MFSLKYNFYYFCILLKFVFLQQDENSPEKQKEESKDLKEARIEASLKEREKRVQDILAVHLKRRENEQRRHKLNEAVVNFNALLTDLVCVY